MLNARTPAFYTGSFIPSYTEPNTPYLSISELTRAMNTYCSREHFDELQCASTAQHYGERVGVPAPDAALPAVIPAQSHQRVSTPTLAAAMYALSALPK